MAGPKAVQASAQYMELLTGNDQDIAVGGGIAKGVLCDTAGSVLQVVSTKSAFTTIALQAGYNPIEIVSIVGAGTTLVGNVQAYGFD